MGSVITIHNTDTHKNKMRDVVGETFSKSANAGTASETEFRAGEVPDPRDLIYR